MAEPVAAAGAESQGVAFTPAAARRILAAVREVERAAGRGGIGPQRRRHATPEDGLLTGLVAVTWSPSQTDKNLITINPCDRHGGSVYTDITLTVYISLPRDNEPSGLETTLAAGTRVYYLPFLDEDGVEGLIVGLMGGQPHIVLNDADQHTDTTADTETPAAGDMIVRTLESSTPLWSYLAAPATHAALVFHSTDKVKWVTAGTDYTVLQRKADDTIGFDWVRAHG